ncbi:hypothetical protein BFO_0868 [Tannerella forsythia 92A2]|uniref:Uncharacterized protein n=1 Tax=Tannerella forsythia (strain ATCC 43037 / JCM 10827 / CCUG 21028 A / KCTC 5666 / FDC 338) TaxID=203275 RepID=G8UP21_TANFA|nr:hypothetical protein BFO_0868 [Tannerella forsythia 92A2]
MGLIPAQTDKELSERLSDFPKRKFSPYCFMTGQKGRFLIQ